MASLWFYLPVLSPPLFAAPLWEEGRSTPLAEQACRVLKPEGHLILYCGNYCGPDWSRRLGDAGLIHKASPWLQHNGRCQILPELKMRMDGKPVLIYSRIWRTYPNQVLSNVIQGGGRDKRYHHWGQDVGSAIHLIKHYTKPGDMVLDPFAGAATTLLAAALLGRKATGYEIDEECFLDACDRLDADLAK